MWKDETQRSEQVRSAALAAALRPPDPETRLDDGKTYSKKTTILLFLIACSLASLCVMLATYNGLAVLGKTENILWLIGGLLAAAFFSYWIWRLQPLVSKKIGIIGPTIAVSICVLFTVGLYTSPVVVDGKVALNTSSTANEVNYIIQARDNLYRLHELDAELGLSDAESWSKANDFDKGKALAAEIGLHYKNIMDGSGPPSGVLADPTRHLLAAAYACVQAYDIKIKLLRSDDAGLRAQLATARAAFAAELVASGQSLKTATATLGYKIPLSREETAQ